MAGLAHPHAMTPSTPGRTRTAPPRMPSSWWSAPRIRTYLLFDATGLVYLLAGFIALRLVWALGEGPEVWGSALAGLSNPLYIVFHLVTLASVIFVGVEFFRRFPKAQPPRIGPLKPPPQPVILATLYVAWILIAGVLSLVLAGVLF
jgi:fumarate reductase subunit C